MGYPGGPQARRRCPAPQRRPVRRGSPYRRRGRRDRGLFLAVAAAALTAQVGAAMVGIGYSFGITETPPAPPRDASTALVSAESAPAAAPAAPAAGNGLGYSVPVRLTIARVGIDTDLMTLGMNPDRTVQVPPDDPHAPAGWYRGNPSPGETGTAVILGHVDAHGGKAVFYPLGLTRAGDQVLVRRADGSTVPFVVDRVASYPRDRFPTDEVYGGADRPVLRLVTCGGVYDKSAGGYQENVVVFASMAPVEDR